MVRKVKSVFFVGVEVGAGCQREQARLIEQRLVGQRFQLAPDLLGPFHDGYVLRALPHGQPGNPRVTVARAKGMRRLEAVDAHHIDTRLGQLIGGSGAHCTQTDDDYFTVLHGQRSLKKALVESRCSQETKN